MDQEVGRELGREFGAINYLKVVNLFSYFQSIDLRLLTLFTENIPISTRTARTAT